MADRATTVARRVWRGLRREARRSQPPTHTAQLRERRTGLANSSRPAAGPAPRRSPRLQAGRSAGCWSAGRGGAWASCRRRHLRPTRMRCPSPLRTGRGSPAVTKSVRSRANAAVEAAIIRQPAASARPVPHLRTRAGVATRPGSDPMLAAPMSSPISPAVSVVSATRTGPSTAMVATTAAPVVWTAVEIDHDDRRGRRAVAAGHLYYIYYCRCPSHR